MRRLLPILSLLAAPQAVLAQAQALFDCITQPSVPSVTLSTGLASDGSLTVSIEGHSGSWHYRYTPNGDACSSEQTETTANPAGISRGSLYLFAAYSDSSCSTLLACSDRTLTNPSDPFDPRGLIASAVTDTTATLSAAALLIAESHSWADWQYRRTAPSPAGDCLGQLGSTLNLTDLTPNTDYEYAAYFDSQCRHESASVNFKTLPEPPAGPATPTSVSVTRGDGTLTATWPAVAGATAYHVTYTFDTPGNDASWSLADLDHPTNSITISGVDNDKTYVVGVRARNADGGSAWRNSPPAGPFKPEPPASISVTRGDGALTAAWPAVDGATGYHVTYTSDGGASWSLADLNHPTNSITIDGTDNAETYVVAVRTLAAYGGSDWRNSAPALATPELVAVDRQLAVSWASPALERNSFGVIDYEVRYQQSGASAWTPHPHHGVGRSATIVGLTNDTSYRVQVRADTATAEGAWSLSASGAPAEPSGGGGPGCGVERPVLGGLALASDPGSDDAYAPGDAIVLAATFSAPVRTLHGGVAMTFELGGQARAADYAGGSGSATLSFRYVVAAGDAGAVRIPAGALAGDPGRIQGLCGLAADLNAGSLQPDEDGHAVGTLVHVPLLPPASDPHQQGFVRIINHSPKAGYVNILGIDDPGDQHGPITLSLGANAATHLNAADLENGNAAKGLPSGLGTGVGYWRLVLEDVVGGAELQIEAVGYIRETDGFLSPISTVAPLRGNARQPWLGIFNPAGDDQRSAFRMFNVANQQASMTITGTDDAGRAAGPLSLTFPPLASMGFGAHELESGGPGLTGMFGDGTGRWRLDFDVTGSPVAVMGLLIGASGHLTNLSTAPQHKQGDAQVLPLLLAASDPRGRQSFARVINHSESAGTVRIDAYDDDGQAYGPLELSIAGLAAVELTAQDLEQGNTGKGLTGSVGAPSTGNWRLSLTTDLSIDALAYVHHEDGLLTSIHDLAPQRGGVHRVPTFNPASNPKYRSLLRIVNPGADPARVTISGIDGEGLLPGSDVVVQLPPGHSTTLDARRLEQGGPNVEGALGNGASKWRLLVSSAQPIMVMSLMEGPLGHLVNLSSRPLRTN